LVWDGAVAMLITMVGGHSASQQVIGCPYVTQLEHGSGDVVCLPIAEGKASVAETAVADLIGQLIHDFGINKVDL